MKFLNVFEANKQYKFNIAVYKSFGRYLDHERHDINNDSWETECQDKMVHHGCEDNPTAYGYVDTDGAIYGVIPEWCIEVKE